MFSIILKASFKVDTEALIDLSSYVLKLSKNFENALNKVLCGSRILESPHILRYEAEENKF